MASILAHGGEVKGPMQGKITADWVSYTQYGISAVWGALGAVAVVWVFSATRKDNKTGQNKEIEKRRRGVLIPLVGRILIKSTCACRRICGKSRLPRYG